MWRLGPWRRETVLAFLISSDACLRWIGVCDFEHGIVGLDWRLVGLTQKFTGIYETMDDIFTTTSTQVSEMTPHISLNDLALLASCKAHLTATSELWT